MIISSCVMFFSAVNYQIAATNASSKAIASAIARATSVAQAIVQAYADCDLYSPFTGNLAVNGPLNNNGQGCK
jgi:hypothetical protein